MHVRLHTLVLAAAALVAPGLAFGGGTIEGFYGIARPPGTSFHSDVSGAVHDPDLFNNSQQIAGADILFNLMWLEFGAVADHSWASGKASQTAVGALLGPRLDAGPVRLDLLGEAGAHRFGNLGSETNGNKDEWFGYVGLRPGAAFRFAPPGEPGVILGVWTFVRWDLSSKRVPVTAANAGNATAGSLKLGGSTIGATLRLGYEF